MSEQADPLEPVLAAGEIQGNVLGGFNKDHQAVLPMRFADGAAAVAAARAWLSSSILPLITWLPEVVTLKRRRRAARADAGAEPTEPTRLWVSIAFSFQGLRKLSPEADGFTGVFRDGLDAGASARIGDPVDPGINGHISRWLVGKPGDVPDVLIILAGDDPNVVRDGVDRLLARAGAAGVTCPFYDIGHDLSHHAMPGMPGGRFPSGREHFGFKDGISQPGVRGRMSSRSDDFLTPRTLPDDGNPGSSQPQFSAPGQPLVCPGEFVLGYRRQNVNFARRSADPYPLGPEPYAPDAGAVAPYWARNGSFLVYRRLCQDVPAFNRFLAAEAARLARDVPEFAGLTAARLGALLVGRWPSGAPVLRTPGAEDESLGQRDGPNNEFAYAVASDPGDGFGPVQADTLGKVCPQAAHVRKVNPRALATDQGSPNATLVRRLLRRGIPYGPPLPLGATDDPAGAVRGLLFLSYQASIAEQFEFLAKSWMNDVGKPTNFGPSPGPGHDMIVGQSPAGGQDGHRFCLLGNSRSRVSTVGVPSPRQWVFATGGGYFFAPSRSALALLAGPGDLPIA